MKPLSREELMEWEEHCTIDDTPYAGWVTLMIWGGFTAFSWGVVLAVIYTAYLWIYM